jgi:transcriptional regulator with XRE-family HTH domain
VTDARYTYTAGMPAARVGWLVARARSVAGIGERDLASSVGVPVRTVRRWERGDLVPSDDEVEAIASACGARLTELLPRRAVVAYDPSTGIMQMSDQAVAIPMTSLDNDTVLAAFVALVRRVRGLRLDQDVKVRQEDLDSLGEVLDLDDQELEERLMRIIGLSRSQAAAVRAQMLRKRLAVPMVGMLATLSVFCVSRVFNTGSEQVKAIDGKVETVFPMPTTTTTVAPATEGSAAAPVVTPAIAASPSSAAPAPATQAATAAAAPEASAQVTSTTQPFVGPRFPVRTGPPASTGTRRAASGGSGEQSPADPGSDGGTPATEPSTGGGSGGGGSTPNPPAQPPPSTTTTTNPEAVNLPPVVSPIAGTDGPTGITPVTPPATPPPTPPPSPPTDPTPPPTPPPTSPTTVPPIDDGHTTETTPVTPPPTSPPVSSPPPVGGIGTTGADEPGSS